MKTETITIDEWRKKGTELFGKDTKQWRFICPICKTPQNVEDFMNAGLNEEQARESIAVKCIGRYLPNSQVAIGRDTEITKGKPCNYSGYGLFRLNPVAVEFEDGDIFKIFDFHT